MSKRTAGTVADTAIGTARALWIQSVTHLISNNPEKYSGEMSDPESYFAKEIFGNAWKKEGDELKKEISSDKNDPTVEWLSITKIIVAYAVRANFYDRGNENKHFADARNNLNIPSLPSIPDEILSNKKPRSEAWGYAVDATLWLGILLARHYEHRSVKDLYSEIGKIAINARHNALGGSREKGNKIREIWASGKYSSRDICAEQECAAMEMSFAAARKALRNTPDPT
jgi:hypothetical protein